MDLVNPLTRVEKKALGGWLPGRVWERGDWVTSTPPRHFPCVMSYAERTRAKAGDGAVAAAPACLLAHVMTVCNPMPYPCNPTCTSLLTPPLPYTTPPLASLPPTSGPPPVSACTGDPNMQYPPDPSACAPRVPCPRGSACAGDPNMRVLQKGDVLQLERKGYYIVDEPLGAKGPGRPIVLFSIPDGRMKASLSAAAGAAAGKA